MEVLEDAACSALQRTIETDPSNDVKAQALKELATHHLHKVWNLVEGLHEAPARAIQILIESYEAGSTTIVSVLEQIRREADQISEREVGAKIEYLIGLIRDPSEGTAVAPVDKSSSKICE